MEIENPVAIITGASSGIGAEFARTLARRKFRLVLVARRRERLDALAEEISRRHAVDVEVLAADLGRAEDVDKVACRIAGERRLELLVNNAGFGILGSFHQTNADAQLQMYRVHVLAAMRLCHAALPGLIARDRGGIINVASVAGFTRMPGQASYVSTKAWMIAFTECLHLELAEARSHVVVQALCPGFTYTEFHDALGLDRNTVMPFRSLWLTAEFVVAESLKGYDRKKWLVIPGWRYRLLVLLLTRLPHLMLHPVMSRMARRRAAAERR